MNNLNAIRYTLYAIGLVSLVTGCEDNKHKLSLEEENLKLQREQRQTAEQLGESQAQNKQLRKQIKVLSELAPEVRLENLYNIQKIKITRYTNLYDKDKDGRKEKLLVYIQPSDAQGDVIKAAGAVDVQLWDLNKPEGEALLGKWHVKPEELKDMWFATVITMNYRLIFDVAEIIDEFEEPLTVKVTFTDYLSGKVFTEQKVIEP
ncbi:hypothetical protein ES708_23719 [subsurface metagenome]